MATDAEAELAVADDDGGVGVAAGYLREAEAERVDDGAGGAAAGTSHQAEAMRSTASLLMMWVSTKLRFGVFFFYMN